MNMESKQISDTSFPGVIKKRKVITLEAKLDIIRRAENGETPSQIGKSLGLNRSTIGTIIKDKDRILQHMKGIVPHKSTIITKKRAGIYGEMEKLLLLWLNDQIHCKIPLSMKLIQEKARSLFDDLKSRENSEVQLSETFKASSGWFWRFKARAGLNVKVTDESGNDVEATSGFLDDLKGMIEEGSYTAEEVFNCDDTDLYWEKTSEIPTKKAKLEVLPSTHQSTEPNELKVFVSENIKQEYDLESITPNPPRTDVNLRGSGGSREECESASLSEEVEQGNSDVLFPQRPESYKIRHNNHVMHVLESLAGDESFMDVTLTAQGNAIKAHKSVLSAVSSYFRRVLKENPCQHPIIIMPRDICFQELNNIISYIYKGEITVSAEDVSSLLKTAQILQVTGLSPADSGNEASEIINQLQGLPTELFPNTSSSALSKKSSRQKQPPPPPSLLQQGNEATPSEIQGRINPLEFLNTDMVLVKEEIQTDNEDDDTNLQPFMDEFGLNNPIELSSDLVSECAETSFRQKNVDEETNNSSMVLPNSTIKYGEPGVSTLEKESSKPSKLPPKPLECPYCFETHQPVDILKTHLRLKHPSKPSFICDCGKVFLRISFLNVHLKKCKAVNVENKSFC